MSASSRLRVCRLRSAIVCPPRLRRPQRPQPPLWPALPCCRTATTTTATTTAPAAAQRGNQAADDPNFESILDKPVRRVHITERKHGFGLIFLALIPVTAFGLGTWQVQRLGWKNNLVATLEDRILRDPLPLPPRLDPAAIPDFDFRRIYTSGRFLHHQEMLVGPRMRDGRPGYLVFTPLQRADADTILVSRGWIHKAKARQSDRHPDALPRHEVTVEALLRQPWAKNLFTPDNQPDKGEFYFPDIDQMARLTGSQPVVIEATLEPDYLQLAQLESQGVPIGRVPEVGLRNQHAQYIFTWYSLALATSVMFWMVVKRPTSGHVRRIYLNQ